MGLREDLERFKKKPLPDNTDVLANQEVNRTLPTGSDEVYKPTGEPVTQQDRETSWGTEGGWTREDFERWEQGGLQDPAFDPVMIFSGAAGATAFRAITTGMTSIFGGLVRGGVAGGAGVAGETVTGIPASMIEDEHPYLALALSLAGGVASAVTLERALEKTAFNSIRKFNPTFFKSHVDKTVTGNSLHFSEDLLAELKDYAYRADGGDHEAARKYVDRLNTAMYKDLEKAGIPKEQAIYELQIPKIKKEVSSKVKQLVKLPPEKLTFDDYGDIQRLSQAETYNEAWKGFKLVRDASNNRLAREEYFNLPHTRMVNTIQSSYKLSPTIFADYAVPAKTANMIKKKYPDMFRKNGVKDISKFMQTFKYEKPVDFFNDLASAPTFSQVKRKIANKTSQEWNRTFQEMWSEKALQKEQQYLETVLGVEKRGQIPKVVPKNIVGDILNDVKALKNSTVIVNKQVDRMFKAGQKVGALQTRLQEIQKLLAYKSAVKKARKIRMWENSFKRKLKTKSLPPEYRSQLKTLLKPFVYTSKYVPDADTHILTFLDNKAKEGILAAEVLKDELSYLVNRMSGLEKAKLNYDDYEQFHNIITALHKLGVNEKTYTILGKQEFIDDIINDIHISATSTFGNKGSIYQGRVVPQNQLDIIGKQASGFLAESREKISDLFGRYLAHTARMEKIVTALDGFKTMGRAWRTIFKPFIDAETLESNLSERILKRHKEIFDTHGKRGRYWNKVHTVGDIKATKEEAVMMALNMGNPDNKKVLLHGLSGGKPSLREEDIQKFLDEVLTDVDKQLVEDIWNLLDDLYPVTNKTYREIMGTDLKKVEGRYFPIVQDIRFKDRDRKITDVFETTNADYYWASVQRNSTFNRKGGVTAVKLDFDVIAQHLREVVHLNAYWKPGTEVQKIIKDTNFKTLVEANLGRHIYRQFDPWLKNMMRPSLTGSRLARQLRANVTVAQLGLKVSTMLVQPLSAISAIPQTGVKNMILSMGEFAANPKQFVEAINEVSPQMRNRAHSWNRDLSEANKDIVRIRGAKEKIFQNPRMRDFFFTLIRIADQFGAYPTWHAGFKRGMEINSGDVDKAIEYANQTVRVTQPQSAAKDLPRIMRDTEIQRWFTMFYSYFSVLENQIIEAINRYKVKDINFGKLSNDMLYMIMLPAIASYSIKNMKAPEKEELPGLVLNHAAGSFPGVRDIVSSATQGYGYELSPIESAPKELIRLMKGAATYVDDDPYNQRDLTYPLLSTLGYTFGLPTGQALTVLRGISDMESDHDYTWWDIMVKKRDAEE